MKISLYWIEQLLGAPLNAEPAALADPLLRLGFEVSSVQKYPGSSGVVAAKVLEVGGHPNADRLRIAKVTDGKETLEVVCGAPNVAVGQIVFWAKVGSVMANGQAIQAAAIRGVQSPGMLCSAKELGMGEDQGGILVLQENIELGSPADRVVPLRDTILEIEVTPNRPDALSMLGMAREIAAALGLAMRGPEVPAAPSGLAPYPVEILDKENCFQYIARKIEDGDVGPSPLKTQLLLARCGIRPINNVVDATNFMLLETGHPLHAFDADRLEGGKIVVRKAAAGEKMAALDGETYELDPSVLVIADAKRPVAIAGIMGGEATGVTATTKNVLLESAVFNTRIVRYGRAKLNLSSESSYRFERGVGPWSCALSSAGAAQMIERTAGGKPTGYVNARVDRPSAQPVLVRAARVKKILGEPIGLQEMETALKKIGARPDAKPDGLSVQSPPWRLDLHLEEDWIEEIARMRGYDKTPSAGAQARLTPATPTLGQTSTARQARKTLQALGFFEAGNYGLVAKKLALLFNDESALAELANPLSEEQSVLRPNLLIELLQNLKLNLSYQKKGVRLFEAGAVFSKTQDGFVETPCLAGVAAGPALPSTWQAKTAQPVDFYWIKGALEQVLASAKTAAFEFQPAEPRWTRAILHPYYSYTLALGPGKEPAGILGVAHPRLCKSFDLDAAPILFQLDLAKLARHSLPHGRIKDVLRTPSIQRDLTVWVGEEAPWTDLLKEIQKAGGQLLEDCRLFDLYRDPSAPGQKSLSFTLTFHRPEKTLDDATANQLRDQILAALNAQFKAELRKKA